MSDDFIPESIDVLLESMEPEKKLPVLDKVPKGDKMALVKFDGTAITEQGNVVRHNWFKGVEVDSAAYSDLLLTPTEARQLKTAHQRMKTGASAASILTCYGPSVFPMARTCPYVQLQEQLDRAGEARRVVPVGKKCPVEQDIMVNALKNLAEEFDIMDGHNSYTDQRYAFELAEIEVLEHRINTVLATDPALQGLTEEKLVSTVITKAGDQQDNYVKDMADLLKVKEKLWARKDKIRKELVGTRREQRLVQAREGEISVDASQHMAEIAKRLKQLQVHGIAKE